MKRSRTLRRVSLRFDLQSHSTSSDGALQPAEVVERAAAAGVELLALSDHDTIGGVADAVAAGERYGVRISPAVEISAVDDGAGADAGAGAAGAGDEQTASEHVTRELHIVGYEIDYEGQLLQSRLAEFLADREKRTLRMRDGLREVGFELDEAAIERRIAESKPIGRPHLAEAVLNAPANAQRLADEQIDDIGGLIRGYLIDGKPAFRLRETPTVAEAIERSTTPAASRSGRIRSGTSKTTVKCSRASSAFARSASTASRRSTSRTTSARRACCSRAASSSAC